MSENINEADFDAFYGLGMLQRVRNLINDLAPVTRRDDWWASDGPYEIIAMHLMSSKPEEPTCRQALSSTCSGSA